MPLLTVLHPDGARAVEQDFFDQRVGPQVEIAVFSGRV